jgi:hypothetical protein
VRRAPQRKPSSSSTSRRRRSGSFCDPSRGRRSFPSSFRPTPNTVSVGSTTPLTRGRGSSRPWVCDEASGTPGLERLPLRRHSLPERLNAMHPVRVPAMHDA